MSEHTNSKFDVALAQALKIAEIAKITKQRDDLLAACEDALKCFNYDPDMQEDFAPEIKQLNQAIAKAKGD